MTHLTGKFNAHLRHLCMLFADEAIAPGDAEGIGALKGLITEPTIPIEAKGVDVVNADNHLHIIMASNEKWVVPAGENARRFAMFDVPGTRRGDKQYFSALFDELDNGGLGAMLRDLLVLDLKGWHPDTHRPETKALEAQKIRSLRGVEQQWYNILLTGELPIYRTLRDGQGAPLKLIRISTNDLVLYMQTSLRGCTVTANEISDLLGKRGMQFKQVESQRPRGYVLPSLKEARERWDGHHFPAEWPATDEDTPADTADEHGWHDAKPAAVF